jgi:hypothetical protein
MSFKSEGLCFQSAKQAIPRLSRVSDGGWSNPTSNGLCGLGPRLRARNGMQKSGTGHQLGVSRFKAGCLLPLTVLLLISLPRISLQSVVEILKSTGFVGATSATSYIQQCPCQAHPSTLRPITCNSPLKVRRACCIPALASRNCPRPATANVQAVT